MWDDKGVAHCRLSVGSIIILTYDTAEYVNIHYIINVVRISLCKPKLTMKIGRRLFSHAYGPSMVIKNILSGTFFTTPPYPIGLGKTLINCDPVRENGLNRT